MEALRFDIAIEERVVVLVEKDGTARKCTLKGINGPQRAAYLNKIGSKIKIVNGKVQGFTDYSGTESCLLSLCFYDEEGKLFTVDKLEALPSKVLISLNKAALELSGMNEEGVKEAKNG